MKRGIICLAILGAWITLLPSPPARADGPARDDCVGDVDGDGDTDLSDLGILLVAWDSTPGDPNWDPPADLDGDDDVDSSDLGILLADWACGTDDPGCDAGPSDALAFRVDTVDNSAVMPPNYYTFDLVVEVEEGDDWTAILAEAELTDCPDCMFYQEPTFGDDWPQPNFFGFVPELEFDSWYTTGAGFPNTDHSPPEGNGFAEIDNQDQYLRAVWFDRSEPGGGAFVLARYTIMVPEGSLIVPGVVPAGDANDAPVVGTLVGSATSKVGWGNCNTFAFDVVSPCPADLDHDLDVDQADLGILLADWGCASDCVGDADGDDDTDQSDLGMLLATWGALCGPDCNGNGSSDTQDINDGTSEDCNENGIPDECELGGTEDCNSNGVPDLCDIHAGTSEDCNENGIPDECEEGWGLDCNGNGASDFCDIYDGTSQDFNNNGIPDECEENRTVYVDDDAPNDPGPGDPNVSDPDEDGTPEHPFDAIQEAMDPSISGDTILVAEGVYTGTGNKEIDFGGRAVLLSSVNGPQTCTIDMEGSGRGFLFQSGESRAAQLTGFTITNGYAYVGAGIRCTNGSSPTVTDCIISGNLAWRSGGGVCCLDSDPAFIDCMISGNTADDLDGGGVCCDFSNPAFIDCMVVGNTADRDGGGVSCYLSDPAFIDCIIAGNTSRWCGGGIRCHDSGSTFTNCLIAGNSADDEGGGLCCLCCLSSEPAFVNCTFAGNTAGASGGGIHSDMSEPTFTNCIIADNTAADRGGGMHCCFWSAPTFTNCTWAGNAADVGAALACDSDEWFPSWVRMWNCILWNGSDQIWDDDGSTLTFTYCDIQGGWPGTGNIDADPLFVDPDGPDDDPDTWEDNDYRLGPGSPCIDAANNDVVPRDRFDLDQDGDTGEPIPFDLDGNPRFVDDPDTDDTGHGTPPIVDMGAYEFQVPRVGDLDRDGCVDQADLGILLADWGCTGGNCPGDCDNDGVTEQSDLGVLLAHWGTTCP
jgi:hypothetical protein